jgi:hypothetical protein
METQTSPLSPMLIIGWVSIVRNHKITFHPLLSQITSSVIITRLNASSPPSSNKTCFKFTQVTWKMWRGLKDT